MFDQKIWIFLSTLFVASFLPGCSTEKLLYSILGGTLYGAQSPGAEIEQIYYLGVFDPLEQIPPTIYRVRVRGQASVLSSTRFASGWVPAPLIDTLGSSLSFDSESGRVKFDKAEEGLSSGLPLGRRMMMFGPEGFMEAPEGHRLVLVMGANPDGFFEGMDAALGAVVEAGVDGRNLELTKLLLEANVAQRGDESRVKSAREDLESRLPKEIK